MTPGKGSFDPFRLRGSVLEPCLPWEPWDEESIGISTTSVFKVPFPSPRQESLWPSREVGATRNVCVLCVYYVMSLLGVGKREGGDLNS